MSTAGVVVNTDDLCAVIDPLDNGALRTQGIIQSLELAVEVNEAVVDTRAVDVVSDDLTPRIDALDHSALCREGRRSL